MNASGFTIGDRVVLRGVAGRVWSVEGIRPERLLLKSRDEAGGPVRVEVEPEHADLFEESDA